MKSAVEDKIKQGKKEKEKSLKEYEDLAEKYSKEVNVEITLPDSINQHQLEIKKENGSTIGKINFGNATIKIITRGSISVERQDEQFPVKKK